MKTFLIKPLFYAAFTALTVSSCKKDLDNYNPEKEMNTTISGRTNQEEPELESILLLIDEESIDNGTQPNNFSAIDVNDQIARIGLRQTLNYFNNNIGNTINLFTGDVGDEGWHAIKTIPNSWVNAGPTTYGFRNFLMAGPGLGGGNNPEALLDKISNVTPLRAKGLQMLIGRTVFAVVYDSDISINYGPLNGSLKGENLGLVAFEVLNVTNRSGGSSGSLPSVTVRILSVEESNDATFKLFSNAPVPSSSSVPYDTKIHATVPEIILVNAN